MPETIAVRRRSPNDADGRTVAPTTPVPPVDGCEVEPLTGTELLEVTRSGATSAVRVLLPIVAGLDGECELQIRGQWFRIVGGAVAFIDDDPALSGYQVTCTRGGA